MERQVEKRLTLVRVVVRLLNQREFFTLRLVKSALDGIGFLQFLKGENQKFGVMFVVQRTER